MIDFSNKPIFKLRKVSDEDGRDMVREILIE